MKSNSWSRILQRWRHLPIEIENKWLKLLSLGLAVLLFVVARQPVTDVNLRGVRIEYHGTPEGIEISGDIEQSVTLRLRGPRDVVRNLFPNQLSVIADLSRKEPGERVIQFIVDEASLPDNTRLLGIEPPTLKVRLEPTARKTMGIQPQMIGQVADGAELYGVTLDPPAVEIEGPQSLVNKTNQVITESIGLGGRREDFSVTVEIETPHRSLRIRTPRSVVATVQIGERRATRILSNIPVRWTDRQGGEHLLSQTIAIELVGPHSAIQSIRDGDLRAEVVASEIPAGAESAQPRIRLPEYADKHIYIRSIIPKGIKVKKERSVIQPEK
jgi:YbbR domain-containing protein